jgi:hypothetical protein
MQIKILYQKTESLKFIYNEPNVEEVVQAEGHPEEPPVPPIADDVLAMDKLAKPSAHTSRGGLP